MGHRTQDEDTSETERGGVRGTFSISRPSSLITTRLTVEILDKLNFVEKIAIIQVYPF